MLAEADGGGRRAASPAPVCSNLALAECCNAANRFAPHTRGSSRWLRRQTASAAPRGDVVPALRWMSRSAFVTAITDLTEPGAQLQVEDSGRGKGFVGFWPRNFVSSEETRLDFV